MTIKIIETYTGPRKIDTENKNIEMANGKMVKYLRTEIKLIDGETYIAYMINEKQGVPVSVESHRKINEISQEQKVANLRSQRADHVMNEGYVN